MEKVERAYNYQSFTRAESVILNTPKFMAYTSIQQNKANRFGIPSCNLDSW